MKNLIARARDNENGFTLVELLVVILIIGVLAAIAIPAFLNQRKAANDAGTEEDTVNHAKVISTLETTIPNTKVELNKEVLEDLLAQHNLTATFTEGTEWSVSGTLNKSWCVYAYNPDGAQYVDLSTSAIFDNTNGGLNRPPGENSACAGAYIPNEDDWGTPIENATFTVAERFAITGSALVMNNAGKSGQLTEQTITVRFQDPNLTAQDLERQAESATLSNFTRMATSPGTLTPVATEHMGNYSTATFKFQSADTTHVPIAYFKEFTLSYAETPGNTATWNLGVDLYPLSSAPAGSTRVLPINTKSYDWWDNKQDFPAGVTFGAGNWG